MESDEAGVDDREYLEAVDADAIIEHLVGSLPILGDVITSEFVDVIVDVLLHEGCRVSDISLAHLFESQRLVEAGHMVVLEHGGVGFKGWLVFVSRQPECSRNRVLGLCFFSFLLNLLENRESSIHLIRPLICLLVEALIKQVSLS